MIFKNLNRKIHIHFGLFLLFFIWLFSLSGLILNHGNWKFASFWEEREESTTDFRLPENVAIDSISIESIMEYLKIYGEVQKKVQTPDRIEFRVESPGIVNDIQVDLTSGNGIRKQLKYNSWGILRSLHTFNGVDRNAASGSPNWWITQVWRYSMDAIGMGLIIICLSSWIMWFQVRNEFKPGWPIVILSFLLTGYFIFSGLF